jgi:hypothetical protein
MESLGRPDDHAEMLAHHWRSALELARAAGMHDGELADRTRRALRAAGDRAAVLNAHASAAKYYEEALTLWPPDDAEIADLMFRRARALHLATDDAREHALAEARDALVAAGDRAQAGEASAFLGRIAWLRGANEESREHLAAAEQLILDAPPSAATTRVLAHSARQRALDGEIDEGIRLAEEALAMARSLGLVELEAHALTTIGTARLQRAAGGTDELGQALQIAVAANLPPAPILNNLAVAAGRYGDIRRGDELFAEAAENAGRFGDRDNRRFSLGNYIWSRWMLGEWDEALALADQFIAECETSPHLLEYQARTWRAWIRFARGDTAGALADVDEARERGEESGDPEVAAVAALWSGYLYSESGHLEQARANVAAALRRLRGRYVPPDALSALTPVAARLAIEKELLRTLESAPDLPWSNAARVAAQGDHARAADMWASMGSSTLEALHRLAAAEALLAAGRRDEGDAQLDRALAFYRSAGATAFVNRGEALLAASSSADSRLAEAPSLPAPDPTAGLGRQP